MYRNRGAITRLIIKFRTQISNTDTRPPEWSNAQYVNIALHNLASIFRNALFLGNLREYRNKNISLELHSLSYISVAESISVPSTTFT